MPKNIIRFVIFIALIAILSTSRRVESASQPGFPNPVYLPALFKPAIAYLPLLMRLPPCYALTLSHIGNGSDPVASPANSTGCATGKYIAGETIQLSGAAPETGWQITGWTGTTNDVSTAATNTVTMPAADHAASVTYTESLAWLGLDGGAVDSLAVDPQNRNVIYLGTWGSGVYKSVDNGQTWAPARAGLGTSLIWSLAVDPHNSSIVYAGTHKGGFYKSVDGGSTWVLSSNGIQASAVVYTIAIDLASSNHIFIGTRGIARPCGSSTCPPWAGVIYKSEDWGASWVPSVANVGGSGNQFWAYSIAFDPLDPNRVLAAFDGEPGLLRSLDGGRTWLTSEKLRMTNPIGRSVVFDPTSTSPVIAYYGAWQAPKHDNKTAFKSNDGGLSWVSIPNPGLGLNVWKLSIARSSPKTLYLCTLNNGLNNLLKTTDGGQTWFASGLRATTPNAVEIDPNNSNVVYVGTGDVGMFKTTNGGASWAHSQTGFITTWATSLLVSPTDKNLVFMSTYGGGVLKSTDRGLSWIGMSAGLGNLYIHSLVMDPVHSNILFALTDTAGMFRYDLNVGGNWTHISSSLPAFAEGQAFPGLANLSYGPNYPFAIPEKPDIDVHPEIYANQAPAAPASNPPFLALTFAPSDPNIAYLGTYGSGLYKSSNGGSVWNKMGLSGYVLWSLAVDPANSNLVYAATSAPRVVKYSPDGGVTWLDSDLPDPNLIVYSLAASPSVTGVVYTGTTNGVYRFMDGSWSALGLPGVTVTAIAANPVLPGYLYAGTTNGAFFSSDSGNTWQPGPAELANLTVQSINIDPFYLYTVYFSTTGNGVLKVTIN
jgi:photosystem II stability/assembly factor-like uncharacterized protein